MVFYDRVSGNREGPAAPPESNQARRPADLLVRAAGPGERGRSGDSPGGDPAGPDRIARSRLVLPGSSPGLDREPPGAAAAAPPGQASGPAGAGEWMAG
jgi:hypothetical protein